MSGGSGGKDMLDGTGGRIAGAEAAWRRPSRTVNRRTPPATATPKKNQIDI